MKKIALTGCNDGEFEQVCRTLENAGYGLYSDSCDDSLNGDKNLFIRNCGAADFDGDISAAIRNDYDGTFAVLSDDDETDGIIISAWVGSPHFRAVRGDDGIRGLIDQIMFFLGEPEPLEIERKFLIEYPETDFLGKLPNCRMVEISQTYMTDPSGDRVRLRRRGLDGEYAYFLTQKKNITDVKRIEIERRLDEAEYGELLRDGQEKKSLTKDRYCLMYEGQYFEIDVFPFWNDVALMEIELTDENEEVFFPDFVRIIREVTGEKEYNNSYLAKAE